MFKHIILLKGGVLMITCCNLVRKGQDAKVPQDKIGKLYNKIAPVYDIWGKVTESRARSRALELAAIQDGQKVLEVAVGTGLAFYEVVKRNLHGNSIGIDLSEGMLEKAIKRLRAVKSDNYVLKKGSAFNLDIESNSIDVLINNYMFDLIPFNDMNKIIFEFRRVLKINGKLVLVNMTEGEKLSGRLYEGVYRFFPKLMGGCRGVKLEERLIQNGFDVITREYYQQMLFPSEVILAVKK